VQWRISILLKVGSMTADAPKQYDVFISHSSTDKEIADAACAALEQRGIRCWIAPRDVPKGTNWMGAIFDGITRCKAMVLIFSTQANNSVDVCREVQLALKHGLAILPFRVEKVEPQGALAYALQSIQRLDGFEPPLKVQLAALATSVATLLPTDRTAQTGCFESPARHRSRRSAIVGRLTIAFAVTVAVVVIVQLRGGWRSSPPPALSPSVSRTSTSDTDRGASRPTEPRVAMPSIVPASPTSQPSAVLQPAEPPGIQEGSHVVVTALTRGFLDADRTSAHLVPRDAAGVVVKILRGDRLCLLNLDGASSEELWISLDFVAIK